MITPVITAFNRSPDGGRGLARDTRVRCALEEVGQPYEVRPMTFETLKQPAHLARNPFGKIPTFETDDLTLFETGSIVLHIAERHPGLLPADADVRSRAISWMFAAVNSVGPAILEYFNAKVVEADKAWAAERLPIVMDRCRKPLRELASHLGDNEGSTARSAQAT